MNKFQLYNFFAGKSSINEEIAIRKWIEASEQNKKEFMRERKLFDATCLNPQNNTSKKNKHISISVKTIQRIAAAVALIICLSLFLKNYSIVEKQDLLTVMNTVTVPAGQRVKLTLSDSSIVWLNSLSTFKYPSTFKGNRTVELNGEGFFEVKSDKHFPFIVSTSKGCINVTGTVFNVRAFDKDEVFETTLLEGEVKIYTEGKNNKNIVLKPKQKSKLLNNELIVEEVSDFDEFLWRDGLMSFKEKTLDDIVKRFEQQYGVKIVMNQESKHLFRHSYTAKFRTSDGLDYNLDILKKTISFEQKRSNDNQIIFIY
ncbi:MAG: FecR family protein [Paludibacter sp.]|nr:FecR family protein [Paludibacter sp.]